MHRKSILPALACLAAGATLGAQAPERGVATVNALVSGLTVTPRVLIVGARPTDADADLIAWLARGHHVETAYLSLTRGESALNYTGREATAALGAVHVQEALAARAIDGGEQFFTRAYDFGPARNAEDAFAHWDHATLLGDAVAIARTFRPQVIITLFRGDSAERDGHRQVSALIARELYDAAGDTLRYPVAKYGMPWTPLSLYEPGGSVTFDSGEYDRILGRTYADIASESRAQLRSFGFATAPWERTGARYWHRTSVRGADSLAVRDSMSFFFGVDTSFRRLQQNTPWEMVSTGRRPLVVQLPALLAEADSARAALDLAHPASVIPHLKRVVELASAARVLLRSCGHPTRDAASALSNTKCRAEWLDVDASLDLVLQRASDALLAAAGIVVEAVADREFLASGDTARVVVTVFNHGDLPVSVNDVSIAGGIAVRMGAAFRIAPHDSVRIMRNIVTLPYAHPWWIFKRKDDFYPSSTMAINGLPQPTVLMRDFRAQGIAIPEAIRRLSDVTTTITIGMTTVTSSAGDVRFRAADPLLGVRTRPISGVPAVTLDFERALSWAEAGKPLSRPLRVTLTSFSDHPQTFHLNAGLAGKVSIDSAPPMITLAPHEAREVTLRLHGRPDTSHFDLGVTGVTASDTFTVGFRTAQYSYLPPLHFFRESALRVQGVDAHVPRRLSVAYIRGAGDDADVALKEIGIPVYVFNAEGLTRFDLAGVSTVVIGPDAFRVDRNLVTQMPRLLDFVRRGGTLVILPNPEAVASSGILPFPVAFAQPVAEGVTHRVVPVAVIEPRSRLLTWPNIIEPADWMAWTGARAAEVPTAADPRYQPVVEMHDPRQPENRNTILSAPLGTGRLVYTSLTLTQQVMGGSPGALRLFVNLLSAGVQE